MSSPLAGVVLAGGASRRMGRDKATMVFPASGTKTMVESVVEALSARCAPVLVIAAPGQRLPELDATVLRDEVLGVGPLLATGRGLRAAAEAGCERAFVCAVDMPFMSPDLIDELASHVGPDVVLPWDGRDHYLAGVYRTDLAARVDDLVARGERSMRSLVDSVNTQRIVLPETAALTNVNTAADLV
ncbi:molybdenum cofactor guanylyltransferase [Mycolicibacterium confluentis]|uniref:Probable molybdenum cofactor guanylyltransferase n=1 Tax=Mycolicibacterium confluentis TaxID=28047 RepID=A0A7I7XV45_9MYCO|nr:molybdenum cofactor guanylyltransferase [Mycolicibacterium confluentis]MCV7320837.1 molybdenum cofactor guanylyltransferase [Mycolicibacterium confluentis]ORV27114.1 molybdopterin-guanine dinucleotide biosynthesis protein A [Mycolicibacterium confluentis]BBZ32762.1 putative molybdenum cofactor guanylyltransferase [Mycolicibacterium confluentis]